MLAQRLSGPLRFVPGGELLREQSLHHLAERDRRDREALLAREGLERDLQRLHRRIAIVGIGRQRPHHDRRQRGRVEPLVLGPGGRRSHAAGDPVQDLEIAVAGERRRAGRQLIEDGPQREDVAAAIDGATAALLGRHVGELSLERPLLRLGPLERPLGDAEVGDLHRAVVGDEHVRRRDVAVDDPHRLAARAEPRVRVVQPVGGGGDDADGVPELERRGGQVRRAGVRAHELAQVGAVDVLHREERGVAVGADVVDLGDVRVRERRREARLVEEHPEQLGIERVLRQDPLEHDQLLEPLDADAQEPRQIDFGHPTDGQTANRLIAADRTAVARERIYPRHLRGQNIRSRGEGVDGSRAA